MSNIENIQSEYANKRNDLADSQLALQKAKAELDQLNRQEVLSLRGLDGPARTKQQQAFTQQRTAIQEKIESIHSRKNVLVAEIGRLSTIFLNQLNPEEKIAELSDAFPILMFPLRLETRFKTVLNQTQLWLRVYPDDCNINTKEDLLSDTELDNARAFWIEMWKDEGETSEKGAWRSLVSSHGSGRAAWIIKEQYFPVNTKVKRASTDQKILVVISSDVLATADLEPLRSYWASVWLAQGNTDAVSAAFDILKAALGESKALEFIGKYIPENLKDAIPQGITNNKVLLSFLDLPSKEAYSTKRVSWTQAPKTMALPDKFIALAYTGNTRKPFLFENPVKESLHVGPDPSLPEDQQIKKDAQGDLIINEELAWMVDFEKAVSVGMATKINLSPQEAAQGFDKLFVVGIRFSSDPTASKTLLQKLFTDHFHSKDGLGLLKQGTPTNNTEDEPAGYSWIDNSDESYDRILKEKSPDDDALYAKSDGKKLADALNLPADTFRNMANAYGKDQLEAQAMHNALFPATLGYFMEEMMDPLFDDDDIESTKYFLANFVSGRGPLPALRIGKQPYGILPISAYSRLKFSSRGAIDTTHALPITKNPFLPRLYSLLLKMDETWTQLLPQVPYVGKSGDAHQILLDVVGLHANSVEFHQRYAQSLQQLYNQLSLQMGSFWAAFVASLIGQRGKVILQKFNLNADELKLPILEKYFLSKPNPLTGPLVDDVPSSETSPIRDYSADGKNYIEWLATASADSIRTQNFGGNAAPNALLYLLLRHAITLSQSNTGTKLMLSKSLIQSKKVFFDPDFLHIQANETAKSKYEHLFNANPVITGNNNLTLVEHIYTPPILKESAEAKQLRETIEALDLLKDVPTARLERLFVEHLDCCNYRLDAWFTGLTQYKLLEQKRLSATSQKEPGLHLGAYGWLLEVRPENKVLTDVQLTKDFLKETFGSTNLKSDNTNLGYIHAPSINQAATAAILRNAYDSHKNEGTGNPFAINLSSDRVRIANSFLEGMRNGQSLSALLGYQFERGLHDKYTLGKGAVDKFIYPLRKVFPLVADNLNETKSEDTDALEAIAASNVIDGLKLINYLKTSSQKTYPFGIAASYNLPGADATQTKAISDEAARIMGIHDAIADLVLSEQVYQVVQGNFQRAGGNAEAFSKGAYPPDIEVVNTPRSGVALTQKVALQFDANASATHSPYRDAMDNELIPMTPRAQAEPSVNLWLFKLLPPAEKILCKVDYSSPKGKGSIEVSQVHLGLQAIDLLYLFNLDTEQAMTALDDRIASYIISQVSKHPKTTLNIKYTEAIDPSDPSKVSFFELAPLIKNLRKLLIGSKLLSQTEISVPTEGATGTALYDDVQFQNRVQGAKDKLLLLKNPINTLQSSHLFLGSMAEAFKTTLEADITEATLLESILTQFKTDLRTYASIPSPSLKTEILAAFEALITAQVSAGSLVTLKNTYTTALDTYASSFGNIDDLFKGLVGVFNQIALYDHDQTGVGFIHQGLSSVYDTIFTKLDKVIKRWGDKQKEYETLIAGYDPTGDVEVQTSLLQKSERIISTAVTFPIPAINVFKAGLDLKFNAFTSLLANLKALKVNTREKIIDFLNDALPHISNIGLYDSLAFDDVSGTNDLKAEKMQLTLLKEDAKAALDHLGSFIDKKNTDFTTHLDTANGTLVPSEKIAALQNASKVILGEEALILPHFNLESQQGTEFENSYTNSEKLLEFLNTTDERLFPVEDWLAGVSRVREKVHHWENITFLSAAFKGSQATDLVPLQFPFQDEDRWLAMKYRDASKDGTPQEDAFKINGDKLLYTVHFATSFDKTQAQCGVVVDEWTEVLPTEKNITGVAFHYDQPNNEPPQTMLLVTPPELTGNWKWEDLIDAMEETLLMAQKRAVEPSMIEGTSYAQFLPTTMMAVTLYWITLATNLSMNNNIYNKIEIK